MANITDGFKDIFLAGIGAMALGAEKSKEVVDQLISKGELTVDQGKQINSELKHRAASATAGVRDDFLAAQMAAMTPEERADFAQKVASMVAAANEKDADDAVVEAVEDARVAAEEAEADGGAGSAE